MPRTKVDITGFQYRKFNDFVRGELKRRRLSQGKLAEYLNMERASLTYRLSGDTEWKFKEVLETLEFFDVGLDEIIDKRRKSKNGKNDTITD